MNSINWVLASAIVLPMSVQTFSGFVESARTANTILVDGCPVACGKKTLERHGV
ncbi:MAG TPA: putative zinc-binding protein [Syntrophorhabdaceae bacterium]|nr:putative zinc-binding protein [Syntrophorhabdaceae bacterium]HOF58592.1 putative zinc-binding protein [Syntrophorhabdaceae bacterium]HOS06431.1 putative zinc-binding protein [Syntrophorhabdaceae bacterium]HPL41934.1 putative zinc-binding protein [Syntrophorhabdaceae bacterium]